MASAGQSALYYRQGIDINDLDLAVDDEGLFALFVRPETRDFLFHGLGILIGSVDFSDEGPVSPTLGAKRDDKLH